MDWRLMGDAHLHIRRPHRYVLSVVVPGLVWLQNRRLGRVSSTGHRRHAMRARVTRSLQQSKVQIKTSTNASGNKSTKQLFFCSRRSSPERERLFVLNILLGIKCDLQKKFPITSINDCCGVFTWPLTQRPRCDLDSLFLILLSSNGSNKWKDIKITSH